MGRIVNHLLGAREQPLPGVRGLIRANQIRIYLSEMDLTLWNRSKDTDQSLQLLSTDFKLLKSLNLLQSVANIKNENKLSVVIIIFLHTFRFEKIEMILGPVNIFDCVRDFFPVEIDIFWDFVVGGLRKLKIDKH